MIIFLSYSRTYMYTIAVSMFIYIVLNSLTIDVLYVKKNCTFMWPVNSTCDKNNSVIFFLFIEVVTMMTPRPGLVYSVYTHFSYFVHPFVFVVYHILVTIFRFLFYMSGQDLHISPYFSLHQYSPI